MRECFLGMRDVPRLRATDDEKRVNRFRRQLIDLSDYLGNNGERVDGLR